MKNKILIVIFQFTLVLIIILFLNTNLFSLKDEQIETNNCITAQCHNTYLKNKFIHDPLKKDCNFCHKYNTGKHPEDAGEEYVLTKKYPQLCFDCHKKDASEAESIHPIFEEGNCQECHSPHSANNKFLILEFEGKAICVKCHNPFDGKKVIHKPSLDGHCVKCHNPHFSSLEKLIRTEQPDLCLDCHNKPIQTEKRLLSNIKEKLSLRKVHSPVESGKCTDCHAPHSSDNNAMLIRKFFPQNYVEGKFESFQLCFACHSEQLMLSPTSDSLTNFRNGTRNLHYVHVNKVKARNCIDCHDVHGSNNLRTIKDFVQFGNWKMPIKFVKSDSGGTCSPGCHKTQSYVYHNKYTDHSIVAGVANIDEVSDNEAIIENDTIEETDEEVVIEGVNTNTVQNIQTQEKKTSVTSNKVTKKVIVRIKKGETKAFVSKNIKSNEISSAMKSYMNSLSKYLKKKKSTRLLIEVVSDYREIENSQQQAELFATNVVSYFTSKGISNSRLIIKPKSSILSESKTNSVFDNSKKRIFIFKVID